LVWNQLSDGIKRLFYIITTIAMENKNNQIILIDEPELGLHPIQLIHLMDFIKEQSETKQIVIATHSLSILNTLRDDELDKILLTNYDNQKGTTICHLSESTKREASLYMKEDGWLSNYWLYVDFENQKEFAL
jgi:predicted ATPase